MSGREPSGSEKSGGGEKSGNRESLVGELGGSTAGTGSKQNQENGNKIGRVGEPGVVRRVGTGS